MEQGYHTRHAGHASATPPRRYLQEHGLAESAAHVRCSRSLVRVSAPRARGIRLAGPGRAAGGQTAARNARAARSRQLWATIDVCNPSDQPNTVGIRGSMPGDGKSDDVMYMRFRLQYLDASTKHWVDLATDAASGFVAVGARQVDAPGRAQLPAHARRRASPRSRCAAW